MRFIRLLLTVFMVGAITGAVAWGTLTTLYNHLIRPADLVIKDALGNEWYYGRDVLAETTILGPFYGPVRLRVGRRYVGDVWVPHPKENLGVTVWRQKPDCRIQRRKWAILIGNKEAMYRVELRNCVSTGGPMPPLLLQIEVLPPPDVPTGSQT